MPQESFCNQKTATVKRWARIYVLWAWLSQRSNIDTKQFGRGLKYTKKRQCWGCILNWTTVVAVVFRWGFLKRKSVLVHSNTVPIDP